MTTTTAAMMALLRSEHDELANEVFGRVHRLAPILRMYYGIDRWDKGMAEWPHGVFRDLQCFQ
jgi:hypothetical protein